MANRTTISGATCALTRVVQALSFSVPSVLCLVSTGTLNNFCWGFGVRNCRRLSHDHKFPSVISISWANKLSSPESSTSQSGSTWQLLAISSSTLEKLRNNSPLVGRGVFGSKSGIVCTCIPPEVFGDEVIVLDFPSVSVFLCYIFESSRFLCHLVTFYLLRCEPFFFMLRK